MDDFYVGYLPKAPEGLRGWLLKAVLNLVVIGLGVLIFLVSNFEKSVNSTFEYGIYKEITGTVYRSPVPVIKVASENSTKTLILMNFGKAGVDQLLQDLEDSLGGPLEEYKVTLRGTLIYYDGVTLFELSESKTSIIAAELQGKTPVRTEQNLGRVEFTGELVDSKCFFGVMKPGFGKIHRSCAVRCISGGVPVAVASSDGTYYFLPAQEISKASSLIGKRVNLKATAVQVDDLSYLEIVDIETVSSIETAADAAFKLLGHTPHLDYQVAACD